MELDYKLQRPIAVDDDLPYAEIPPDAPAHGECVTPYARGWNHLHASSVTAVEVLVDLRAGRVAEISTNASHGTVSPVADRAYPSCDEDGSGSGT